MPLGANCFSEIVSLRVMNVEPEAVVSEPG